jgi:hypothetical protein
MTKTIPQIKIVNCETGEEIIRDANTQELAQIQADAAKAQNAKAEADAKATERAAILDRLGITADEVSILLG